MKQQQTPADYMESMKPSREIKHGSVDPVPDGEPGQTILCGLQKNKGKGKPHCQKKAPRGLLVCKKLTMAPRNSHSPTQKQSST